MVKRSWIIIPCLLLLCTSLCLGAGGQIVVTIEPQRYFVKAIGGESQEVMVLIPPNYDPHSFEPRVSDLKRVASAGIYMTIGIPEEKEWAKKLKGVSPKIKIFQQYASEDESEKKQGDHKHAHGQYHDPHVWLSPKMGEVIAKRTFDLLVEMNAEKKEEYQKRLELCLKTLQDFAQEMKTKLSQCPRKAFLVYHPAYGVFAEEFGLTQLAIEKEGKEPKPKDLEYLLNEVKKLGIKELIIQPGMPSGPQRAIAERLGLNMVTINPLTEDWMAELRKLVDAICK